MTLNVAKSVAVCAMILAPGVYATSASALYLNIDNTVVTVGPATSPGSFNNSFDAGQTID